MVARMILQAIVNMDDNDYDYCCDGLSKDCEGRVLWNNVNWFTSSIGFCKHCWANLHKNLSDDELYYSPENLYDKCEGNFYDPETERAVDRVIKVTQ